MNTAGAITAPAGSYTVTATLGACTSLASASAVVNAQPATPSIPTVGTITQPTCALAAGSLTLSGLPATGTWTLTRSGTSSNTTTGTGTTTSISGLAVGTYNYTVSNGTCISSVSANVVINAFVPITNTYTTSWDNGTPTGEQKIVFNGNYSSSGDVSGCSCQVKTGAAVVINSGHTLTITNEVTVLGGSLTFNDTASLVQTNNVTNSGNITYNRITNTKVSSTAYTYWSSPVTPQILYNLSPNTLSSMFYSFDGPSQNWKLESSAITMAVGVGYIVGGPKVATPVPLIQLLLMAFQIMA